MELRNAAALEVESSEAVGDVMRAADIFDIGAHRNYYYNTMR
jgi:hypothetical protein